MNHHGPLTFRCTLPIKIQTCIAKILSIIGKRSTSQTESRFVGPTGGILDLLLFTRHVCDHSFIVTSLDNFLVEVNSKCYFNFEGNINVSESVGAFVLLLLGTLPDKIYVKIVPMYRLSWLKQRGRNWVTSN